MACVVLPCEQEEWWEDKRLFLLLSNISTVWELETLINSHTREDCDKTVLSQRLLDLKGFLVFLKDFCEEGEREKCMNVTLPFIAKSAAKLEELVPESGIPFIVQNEAASVVLGRKLVLSLLANAFLCTFPKPQSKDNKQFTFGGMFSSFTEKRSKRLAAVAGKVKCFLCYFNSVAEGRSDLSGVITIKRQVVGDFELPDLKQWSACRKSLCDLTVDHSNLIESSGSHTLQVDFANKKIGGGALRSGCVQEEIRFAICPELTVSMLVMDLMMPNEAIIINGAQQFSDYTGYGDSFQWAGEHTDQAERDVFGNVLTSVVAIDALSLGQDPEQQYLEDSILRELNKAYTGFLCSDDRGDMFPETVSLHSRGPSVDYIAEYYPHHYSHEGSGLAESALGNVSLGVQSVVGKMAVSDSGKATHLSPIHELTEAAVYTNSIVQDAFDEVVKKSPETIDKFADDLTSSLFATPVSMGADDSVTSTTVTQTKAVSVDQFVDDITASLFDNTSSTVEASVDSLAFSLSASILNSATQKPPLSEATADELARNIISDVFSTLTPPTTPEGLPAQTEAEPTNKPLGNLSDLLADSILSDVVSESSQPMEHPAIYLQVERRGSAGINESPRSSRSSSLTGQTITLLEFTDDLAENLIRDGLSIAQYSNQSMELNIRPRVSEHDAKSIAEDMSKSILASVKDSCKPPPPKTLPVGEQVSKHLPKRRPLFSKQELAVVAARMAKRGSIDFYEGSEFEAPFQLNPRLLTPSSSRHSVGYAWSNASTRDESSRPVSPTDLDRLALGLANDIEDYSELFSKILISDAVYSVFGERPKRQTQNYSFLNLSSLSHETRIDTYFSQLEQAETFPQDSPEELTAQQTAAGLPGQLRSVLLRPVATGNWGCGAFHGDPQLKALIQLIAVSMCDRPKMMYYSFKNKKVDKLETVYEHLRSLGWTCGQLCATLLAYGELSPKKRERKDLFTFLLEK